MQKAIFQHDTDSSVEADAFYFPEKKLVNLTTRHNSVPESSLRTEDSGLILDFDINGRLRSLELLSFEVTVQPELSPPNIARAGSLRLVSEPRSLGTSVAASLSLNPLSCSIIIGGPTPTCWVSFGDTALFGLTEDGELTRILLARIRNGTEYAEYIAKKLRDG